MQTFTVQVVASPTLNPLSNMVIPENAGLQTVNLSGITSGSTNAGVLAVTCSSSKTSLIPNPTVNYTSPNSTGTITFTPVANAYGSATIAVTVNNGQPTNNTVSQSFTVQVDAPPVMSGIATNITIATNSSAGPIAFTIADPDTPLSNLVLRAVSSSPSLIPTNNIVFGGSGSNRTVTLTPLANQNGGATVTIMLTDGYMSVSNVVQLNVLTAPPPPTGLTVVTTGNGAVVTNSWKLTSGVLLYTLSAVPKPGQLFTGWSGGVTSTKTKITVAVSNSVVVHATFIPNPFTPIQGLYSGLFYDAGGIQLGSAGYFTMSVNGRGAYSAKLQLAGKRYSASGQLSFQCKATNQIIRVGNTTLVVNWSVQGGQVTGQMTDNTWVSGLLGDRAFYNAKTNAAPFAGNYTLVFPGQTTNSAVPMGNGYGTVHVDGNGVARFAGELADGTKVSQSTTISSGGDWPLYASLYSGKGLVMSWLTFSNQAASDLTGAVSWIKTAGAPGVFYPAGFTDETMAIGSAYTAPTIGNQVLSFVDGQLVCSAGNLGAGFTNAVALNAAKASGTGVTMSLSLATGAFSGRTTDASSGQTYSFGGVVLQKMNAGYGFLLGSTESSQVALTP
jgi:hypothetical protein